MAAWLLGRWDRRRLSYFAIRCRFLVRRLQPATSFDVDVGATSRSLCALLQHCSPSPVTPGLVPLSLPSSVIRFYSSLSIDRPRHSTFFHYSGSGRRSPSPSSLSVSARLLRTCDYAACLAPPASAALLAISIKIIHYGERHVAHEHAPGNQVLVMR